MKTCSKILLALGFFALTACSTQAINPDPDKPVEVENNPQNSGEPAMSILRNDENLILVKTMEGAVCKNEFEGAKGLFLIYVKREDVERIKREQGEKVFADFETKIETFSSETLQKVIDSLNFSKDPFAFDEEDAQQKLAAQFAALFSTAIAPAINRFQEETTLTLDIKAFPASFVFYQQACLATQEETPEPAPNEHTPNF